MKKHILIILTLFTLGSCGSQKNDTVTPQPPQKFELVSGSVRNKIIADFIRSKGEFRWDWVNTQTLFSAATDHNDSLMTIGYQPEGFQDIDSKMHLIDVQSGEWLQTRESLIQDILATYRQFGVTKSRKEVVTLEHTTFPYIKVKVGLLEIVNQLRASKKVRYIEPSTYYFSSSQEYANVSRTTDLGCNVPYPSSIHVHDKLSNPDGSVTSWNYTNNGIISTWARGIRGKGIGIGLIDTGISIDQPKLSSQFNSDYSNVGRKLYTYSTLYYRTSIWQPLIRDTPFDKCGHGTSMAGVVAAPRSNDRTSTGVAYHSDLYSVKAANDVYIEGSLEKDGISDAFDLLSSKSKVKVISMSLGTLSIFVGQISDAIKGAHGKGKLIFCAAGTSITDFPVVFPANMSQTIAITGVTDRSSLKTARRCHSGKKVDFVVIMQRNGNADRTALTVRNNRSLALDYTAGSSAATATAAGIAALVWSKNPSMSRSTVLQKLKEASSLYPSRSNKHGWGIINAFLASQ